MCLCVLREKQRVVLRWAGQRDVHFERRMASQQYTQHYLYSNLYYLHSLEGEKNEEGLPGCWSERFASEGISENLTLNE